MKIAIIGAGYGGMAAAYDLRKAGHEVTIFEAAQTVGGLASGFKEPHWDWSVEKFYHHWFASDEHMLGLIDELGLSDQVLFPRPYTVMLHKGKWYPFDSIPQALLYPGLGFGLNKIRFGLVGLYLRLTKNWQPLEKVTVEEWMRKWAGKEVYEKMWQPMLIGKFGPFYKDVNMAWFWARIHARTTNLGTFKGGFQAFADRFAEILRDAGVEIRLGVKVESIRREQDGLQVGSETFDKVLVTTSPGLMAKLCSDLPEILFEGAAGTEVDGCGGDGAGAQAPGFGRGLLLVQYAESRSPGGLPARTGPGLSIFGDGGTHQLSFRRRTLAVTISCMPGITWRPGTSISH